MPIKHFKYAPAALKTTFGERVVKLALRIPPGKVTTYGHLVKAAGGHPILAQSVTNILGKAWQNGTKDIPFHRIVYADGRIWVNERRRAERMKKYKKEGIKIDEKDRVKNFREILFKFD
jgi:alkylated DNA nucleotide flippase Atl1